MKQRLFLFLVSLTMAFAASAEDTGYMGFRTNGQHSVTIADLGDATYLVNVTGGDPYALLTAIDRDLTEAQNTVKFEYKLDRSLGGGVEFFFSPIAGGRELQFNLDPAEDWTKAQINIAAAKANFSWGKEGDFMRFDFGNSGAGVLQVRNICIGEYEPPVVDDLEQDADGTCLLSTAKDLETYAGYVNQGMQLNARLKSDIDYTGHTTFMGTKTTSYMSSFDGDGHTITLGYEPTEEYQCLFSYFAGTIKNLVVKGDVTTSQIRLAGLVGTSSGGYINNCVSMVNIHSTAKGNTAYAGIVSNHASAYLYINDCIYAGTIDAPNGENCAGLVGWSAGRTTFTGCLMVGEVNATGEDNYVLGRNPGEITVTGCSYAKADGLKVNGSATLLELGDNAMASGELAYKANMAAGKVTYYQNLGVDAYPVPFSSHKQVYAKGDVRCDGTATGDNITFTNDASSLPPHHYEDGFCTVCGGVDMTYVPQVDGVFQVGNGAQLNWLSRYVNLGNKTDAVLTADIDMKDIDFEPMGTPDKRFSGSIDGQFHRISNLVISRPEQQGVGLIGTVTGTAVLKNLILDATCRIEGKSHAGVIGCAKTNGNITIECVGNEGSVTTSAQNAGGIFGCNDGNCALVTIRNCYTTGSIKSGTEGAALSGWAYGATISGCWSTAEVEGVESADKSMWRGDASSSNIYSTHGQGTAITAEDVTSGKLAYLLNGGLKATPVWYQTIGTDNTPVFDKTHGLVYKFGDEYGDIHDQQSLADFKERTIAEAREYIQDLVATNTIIAEYEVEIDVLEGLQTIDEVVAEAALLTGVRTRLEASAAAYAAFRQKIDDTMAYLESNTGFEGAERDALSDYLSSSDEPNDTYPNGGADYIYTTHDLSTDEVKAETANIDKMLEDAIKYGYLTGSEVTDLLVNADFTSGLDGWQGNQKLTGAIKSATTGMTAAEYYGTGAFDMYQSLTGVKNGVYVLAVNGATRAFNDRLSNYYNARIYMRGQEDGANVSTFVPSVYETRIAAEDAQDGVNCFLTANAADAAPDLTIEDQDANVIAYVIHGRTSMANAASAGRAQNYLMVQVTDGTLTLGYSKPAATGSNEWAGISNLHLFYFATMDEANGYLDKVLACLVARVSTILDNEVDAVEYVQKPNCPKTIVDALTKAKADVEAASTLEQKYALVQTFSTLFDQYIEGRAAYVDMAKEADVVSGVANALHAAGKYSDKELDKVEAATEKVWQAFLDGSYSVEEAKALTALKETGVLPNIADGVCEIQNALHMAYFARKINDGVRLDGKLLGDVNYFSADQMMSNFYGVLDGNHHSITLDINTSETAVGLIRDLQGGTVKNLTILGKIVTAGQFAAAVAGRTSSGTNTISNVASYVDIETSISGDGTHGGLVGVVNNATNISNSLFAGSIKGTSTNNCGGIVGWSSAACRIENCLQAGVFDTDASGCGTFSRNMGSVTVVNSYYLNAYGDKPSGSVTAEQLKSGEVCFTLNKGLDVNPSWYQTLGEDEIPVLDPTHKLVGKSSDGTYSNDAVSEMAKHKGTADDPYPVSNVTDLQAMRNCMTPGQTTYFVLTNDIDMTGVKNWVILNGEQDVANGKPYCNFINFDGKGHVIKNFNTSTGNYPSFFGVLVGEVRNVGFEKASVTSITTGSGILCSHLSHPNYVDADGNMLTSTIENVWVTGDITGTSSYCGALIGRVYGPAVVKNCYVNVKVISTVEATGALAARVTAPFQVENFYAAGSVPAGKGLVGTVAGKGDAVATYTNCVVWNNTDNVFGALADNDVTTGISYYDGSNFAELQQTVVGWDAKTWSCTMEDGAYPVLIGLADAIEGVNATVTKTGSNAIYNLSGQRVQKMQKGIYIVNGKKILVK